MRWLTWCGVAVSVMLAPDHAFAQSSLQIPLQFDFVNPGARSMALGGAFVGVADDATSAFVNPAGLTQLLRPEITVEFRGRRFEQPFLRAGRLSGRPTGLGEDTVSGPMFDTSTDPNGGMSYLSVVVPVRRFTFAGYRHEFVNVEQEYAARGVFQDDRGTNVRELAYDANRAISIDNYGGAVGYRLNSRVRVGVGFSLYAYSLQSTFKRYPHVDFFGAPDKSVEIARFEQNGDQKRVALNAGVLVQAHRRVQLGVNVKRGTSFDFAITEGGFGTPVRTRPNTYAFQTPSAVTVGLSVRPTDLFMVTAEYGHISYSRLKTDYVDVQAGGEPQRFSVPDGHEIHVGAEYALAGVRFVPTLRAGLWRDPDHSVRYQPSAARDLLDERLSVALSGGESLMHYTVGGGASLSEHVEINGAADISARTRTMTASAVFRF